jgi:hypothetical protein
LLSFVGISYHNINIQRQRDYGNLQST